MILLLIFFIKSIFTPSLFRGFGGRIMSFFRFFRGFTNVLVSIIFFIELIFIELRSPIFFMGFLEEVFCLVGSSSFTN